MTPPFRTQSFWENDDAIDQTGKADEEKEMSKRRKVLSVRFVACYISDKYNSFKWRYINAYYR